MFVKNKSASEFYQLFSGIDNNKLFLQIVDREGNLKYGFESPELDISDSTSLCQGIMEASYNFFDPAHFKFDEDFVLGMTEPFLIKRYGEKALFKEQKVVKCKSFEDFNLPAGHSSIFMESFLPFEKPLEKPIESNIDSLINNSPKWITINTSLNHHGMTE